MPRLMPSKVKVSAKVAIPLHDCNRLEAILSVVHRVYCYLVLRVASSFTKQSKPANTRDGQQQKGKPKTSKAH